MLENFLIWLLGENLAVPFAVLTYIILLIIIAGVICFFLPDEKEESSNPNPT